MSSINLVEAQPYKDTVGGFEITLPSSDWTSHILTDTDNFYAVRFQPPEDTFRIVIQRFRASLQITDADDFEAVIEGMILGLEESFGPIKIMERQVDTRLGAGIRGDLVLRGNIHGVDTLQRRSLHAHGPVPPAGLFLITCSCKADQFLVHRGTFEAVIDSLVPAS